MSTETNIDTNIEVQDDLDAFAAELFGESKPPSDNAKSEDVAEPEDVSGAPTEETDTHSAEENDGATEDDESEEEPDDTETDDNAKPKKTNRYQERINEVTAARRQAERERDELKRKLEELTNPAKTTDKAEVTTTSTEPQPNDKNEDGSDKYPLGEFDPQYLKDVVQHMLNEQQAAQQKEAEQKQKLTQEQQYRAERQDEWNTKLVDVQDRYPDYQEKGEQMLAMFEGIDEAYGQYLTDTLMEMDAGPEVFYYLANNLEEAQEIVNAGPRKATIAFAKIEAQLAGNTATKTPQVKTTKAPTPPPQLKGSAVSKTVSLDTDDLDAFSKVLFNKK